MEIELRQVVNATLRLWWVPITAAILLGLAGFGASWVTPTSYKSTTQMLVTSQISGDGVLADDSLTATFKNLVTSGPVLDRVLLELGLDLSRQELTELITVRTLVGTQIIEITVTTEDAQLSADIANALARNFVTTATDLSVGELQRNLDELQKQSDTLRDQITVIDTRLVELDTDANADDSQVQAEIGQLRQQRLQYGQTLADIDGSIRELNTRLSTMSIPVVITDFAQPDEQGTRTSPLLLAMLGVFLGGLLGAAYIIWAAYTDNTLRNEDQLMVGPVLATVTMRDVTDNSSTALSLLAAKVSGIGRNKGGKLALVTPRKGSMLDGVVDGITNSGYTEIVPVEGALDTPDALRCALESNAAILVLALGKSRLNDAEEVAGILRASDVSLLGSVIVSD